MLSRLAEKPKSYRRKVAFSAAAALTSFVFVVWLSTIAERLAGPSGDLAADNSSVAAVPFATEDLATQFDTIQGTLNLLRGTQNVSEIEAEAQASQTPLILDEQE